MGKKSKQANTTKPVQQQNLIDEEPKGQQPKVQESKNDAIKHQKKYKQEKHSSHKKADNVSIKSFQVHSLAQIEKHNHKDDKRVVVDQEVQDVTKLVDRHPRGEKVILDRAGKDATNSFKNGDHPQRVINKAQPKMRKGKVDKTSTAEPSEGYVNNWKTDAAVALILTLTILIFMGYLALSA